MIERFGGYRLAAALAVVVLGASGCAGVGSVLDDMASGAGLGGGSTLSGEVRSVDTRRGRVQIRDEYGDRTETVRIDSRTRVVYRNREYPVSSLERGDYVRVRLDYNRNRDRDRDRDDEMWAETIEVRESARDDNGRYDDRYTGRTVRLDGTVRQVDTRRYYFTLEDRSNRETYAVYIPSRASRDDVRRFERLRRGDRTRAEVRVVRRGQAELVRFR